MRNVCDIYTFNIDSYNPWSAPPVCKDPNHYIEEGRASETMVLELFKYYELLFQKYQLQPKIPYHLTYTDFHITHGKFHIEFGRIVYFEPRRYMLISRAGKFKSFLFAIYDDGNTTVLDDSKCLEIPFELCNYLKQKGII